MNVSCPQCHRVYRLDPARVPMDGVRTRCAACGNPFIVSHGQDASRPGVVAPGRRPEPRAGVGVEPRPESGHPQQERPVAPAFGPQDPRTRARRLARALVSDIKVYNPERWEASRSTGTLRGDFRQEILKSWDEYVGQVGEEMAKRTPFFRDALNDILAGGERVF